MKINSLVVLLLMLAGCADGTGEFAVDSGVDLRVELAPLPESVRADPVLLADRLEDAKVAIEIAGRVIDRSLGWEESLALAQAEASSHPEVHGPTLHQTVSAVLLRHRLLPATTDVMKEEAFRRAEDLVALQSPEAELIAQALEASEGAVPPLQHRVVSAMATSTARATLRRKTDCVSCDQNEVLSAVRGEAPGSGAERTFAALQRLERMAALPE